MITTPRTMADVDSLFKYGLASKNTQLNTDLDELSIWVLWGLYGRQNDF